MLESPQCSDSQGNLPKAPRVLMSSEVPQTSLLSPAVTSLGLKCPGVKALSLQQLGPIKESPQALEPSPVPQIFRQVEFVGLGDHQCHVPAKAPLAGFDALVQQVFMGSPSRNSFNVTDHPDH